VAKDDRRYKKLSKMHDRRYKKLSKMHSDHIENHRFRLFKLTNRSESTGSGASGEDEDCGKGELHFGYSKTVD
jgi:hypothetical protein